MLCGNQECVVIKKKALVFLLEGVPLKERDERTHAEKTTHREATKQWHLQMAKHLLNSAPRQSQGAF